MRGAIAVGGNVVGAAPEAAASEDPDGTGAALEAFWHPERRAPAATAAQAIAAVAEEATVGTLNIGLPVPARLAVLMSSTALF